MQTTLILNKSLNDFGFKFPKFKPLNNNKKKFKTKIQLEITDYTSTKKFICPMTMEKYIDRVIHDKECIYNFCKMKSEWKFTNE